SFREIYSSARIFVNIREKTHESLVLRLQASFRFVLVSTGHRSTMPKRSSGSSYRKSGDIKRLKRQLREMQVNDPK
ncbi:unnamed protein product, partial [Callosobruchus maculatus]